MGDPTVRNGQEMKVGSHGEVDGLERPDSDDTIVAISTAVGPGAIGIVRLSGPQAIGIAGMDFVAARGEPLRSDETYRLLYGHVVDPRTGEVVDEALLAVMRKPHSYTREDVVELHCHGGVAAQRAVLRLMVRSGARLAEPGEFTRRAFVNGRIDLAQAESVAAVVAARSAGALRVAVRQLDGGLSERLRAVRRDMVSLLAHMEAGLDFVDDEVDDVDWEAVADGLTKTRESLLRLLRTALVGRALEHGVRTAIVGRPNVGKSSLLNALLMRERAIVSDIPGTTRDTVEELLEIGGIPIHLVDTAGIRPGGDHVEQLGVARSLKALESADLVLAVVDLSAPGDESDSQLAGAVAPERTIVVGNKVDTVATDADVARRLAAYEEKGRRMCAVSALTGSGLDALRHLIQEVIAGGEKVDFEEPVLAVERQRALVAESVESVERAMAGVRGQRGDELVCEDIRIAVQALGRITGEDLTPDLLDEIFSRFCIGK